MGIQRVSALISIILAALVLFGCSGSTSDPADLVPPIEFWIRTQSVPIPYEAGLMITENWRELGFEVDPQTQEWAFLSAEGMKAHNHQAFMVRWGGKPERVDPYHWLFSMHHSSNAGEGGYNIAGYLNPAYDALAEEFAGSIDTDARREAAGKMQDLLARDVPQPPMFTLHLTNAYNEAEFTNLVPGIGVGVYNFWNFTSITPKTEDTILNLGEVSDITLLNPLVTKSGHDIYMLKNIYDPLVRLDENGRPVNWLASNIEYLDERTVAVELRDDFAFHDGEPLTVEDVKFTFDFAKEVNSPTYSAHIRNIASVEITGPNSLVFNLSDSYAPFVSNTLSQCLILPEHIWGVLYAEEGVEGVLKNDNLPPVGSGPFIFDYWRPNEEFALKANRDYVRPPKIDGIIRTPYTQTLGLVQGLIADEVELTSASLQPLDIQELKKNPDIAVVEFPDAESYLIHYNLRRPPFDDVHIRRALTSAIPRDLIVSAVLDGGGGHTFSLVPENNDFWHNEDVERLDFDMDRARMILEDAGFTWDKEGRIHYPEDYEPRPYL